MKHLDLFSGIGGFAYAVDQVWENAEHIFCDNNKFCQQVLKKHWPKSKIYGDIREITKKQFIADTRSKKSGGIPYLARKKSSSARVDIITGGFPCQPFSQAGKRRGTEDERYLWDEMFRVIQLAKSKWVIIENVRGLLTQSGGMVFDQVCFDLEAINYEVQAFIIPAVAKNAPHRRDRVWIIAHRKNDRSRGRNDEKCRNDKWELVKEKQKRDKIWGESQRRFGESANTVGYRLQGSRNKQNSQRQNRLQNRQKFGWDANWLEVASELCGVDDGLPAKLDGFELTKAGHRNERLKGLGNAIVPQVAIEIMKSIKSNF